MDALLLEAMREVDALTPGSPPIAPAEPSGATKRYTVTWDDVVYVDDGRVMSRAALYLLPAHERRTLGCTS